jgi:hypothetical protein
VEVAVVFHSPDLPRISPVVRVWWEGSPADLVRLARPHLVADLPEEARAEFIAACLLALRLDPHRMAVANLAYPPEWHAEGDDRAGRGYEGPVPEAGV